MTIVALPSWLFLRRRVVCCRCIQTLFSHDHLQQLKGGVVLTEVIGHVAIRIDGQQISSTDE